MTAADDHYAAVVDTGAAYTAFQGWVLSCLWCTYDVRGDTKAEALLKMQMHYDHILGQGGVTVS